MKDIESKTVYTNLEEKFKNKDEHEILDVVGENVVVSELLDNVDKTAKSLRMLDVKKEDVVTVVDDTTEPFINLFYGSNKFGSIFSTPGFPQFSDNPKKFLDKTNSEVLFISQRFYEQLEKNPDTRGKIASTGLKNIIVLPTTVQPTKKLKYNDSIDDLIKKDVPLYKSIEYVDYTKLMIEASLDIKDIEVNQVDGKKDFAYLFTSGSTGEPKVLRMPNSAFLNMVDKIENEDYDFVADKDCYLAILPCNFVTPLETLNFFLQSGVKAYIEPLRDFTKIAEIFYRSKSNVIMCPPSLLDPLYIMVTKNKKNQLNFIKESLLAQKGEKTTTKEKITKLKLMKQMFSKRPNVKYVFSAGEPLPTKLKEAYEKENINILNCTGSGETGPTAINGKPLKGDSYRILDPLTLEVIYRSEEGPTIKPIRGLVEFKDSSSAFNGYLNDEKFTEMCYSSEGDDRYWKYKDIGEVIGTNLKILCRAIDSIILEDKIITPNDINEKILEDERILKCESYPVTINNEDRMVVDFILKEKNRADFEEIILDAHLNILNNLDEMYLPFGYRDNKKFGSNPYTAKLDRETIRQDTKGYISPVTKKEINLSEKYKSAVRVLKRY